MSLVIDCACGQKLRVRDEYAGKHVKCPKCGNVLTAPAPPVEEAIEVLETIEKDKPPTAPAAWDRKQPTPKSMKRKPDDDADSRDETDDEKDRPTPYWLFPGTISTEVMAMEDDGLYFASLKGDALRNALKLLKAGARAEQALGKKATCIAWDWITLIASNQKLRPFTIRYNNGNDVLTKTLTPADHDTRDEIFKKIAKLLAPAWVMTRFHHTPITATYFPLACIGVDFVLTVGLAFLSHVLAGEGEWEGRGRGAAVAALLNLLRYMGPIWTGAVGMVVAAMLGIWLLVRIASPPIEMSIKRAPDEPIEDE